jgi:hypothetical protein
MGLEGFVGNHEIVGNPRGGVVELGEPILCEQSALMSLDSV